MDLSFFFILAVVYGVLFFFDSFFKSCMHYPYDAFLRNTGLTVKFFRINWYTTAINRTIVRWGSAYGKILLQSFNIGVIVSLVLLPIGIILLFITLIQSEKPLINGGGSGSTVSMEILLPGLNLPIDEIWYYIFSLAICSFGHEIGHAFAAVVEDVAVIGIGFQVLFCFPFAYTQLNTEHLNSLKNFRKLRVLCAGIWHNIIIAFVCYLCYSSLGFTLSPIYRVNDSVIVTSIHDKSPLVGEKGLFHGDIIKEINKCRTRDLNSWYDCMLNSIRSKPGYCVSSDFIRLNDETKPVVHDYDGIVQCCDSNDKKVACFEHVDDINKNDPVEIPQHMCLDIRKTVEAASDLCTLECEDGFCIRPLFNNATTILDIQRDHKPNVLYIGHPGDMSQTITVSAFVPKTKYFSSGLADSLLLLLKYNIVFSFGLAVINAIPCFGLDGHHISSTIINKFLAHKMRGQNEREIVVFVVSFLGTLLFLGSIIKVIWSSLSTSLF